MDQSMESTVAMLAFGVAAPLASLVAVVIGCGDTRQNASSKKAAAARRQKRAGVSASSKRKHGDPAAASSKSKSKSRRHGGTSSSKSSKSSKSKLGAKSRHAPSKGAAVSSKSKSKKASGSSKSKRSSSSSKKSGSKRSESRKSSRSKAKAVGLKVAGAAEKSASLRKAGAASGALKTATGGAPDQQQSVSNRGSKSIKKTTLSQYMMDKHYTPVFSSEASELRTEPQQLRFSAKGGQTMVTVFNSAQAKRFAIKVKCSDNQLYRVNPPYTFVEPGQSATFTVYRHNGTAKIDKLVFVTTQVSKEELNAMNPFKDAASTFPMMVVPLITYGGLPFNAADDSQHGHCACSVKA